MTRVAFLFVLALAIPGGPLSAEREVSPIEEPGLKPESGAYFPAPKEARFLDVANGSFEKADNGNPANWSAGGCAAVAGADAPHGERFLRCPEGNKAWIVGPEVSMQPNRFYLISFWLRAGRKVSGNVMTDTAPETRGLGVSWVGWGPTDGQWRRVGYFFRMPAGSSAARFRLRIGGEKGDGKGPVEIDDVRMRTVSDEEYIDVHGLWRERYPEYDLSARATDGCSLALSVKKLRGEGVPGRPFTIWAIGSSYTNFLGNGETLIANLRKRFPKAPTMRYKLHVGNSAPWQYIRGWARQFVATEQPDVILVYATGKPEQMQAMIKDIQSVSTADIIIPSIHFRAHESLDPASVDNETWRTVRDFCQRYNAEFVENRKEWKQYLEKTGKTKADLLTGRVHQNELGRLLINENIVRHFAVCRNPTYDPLTRERRLRATGGTVRVLNDVLTFNGQWAMREAPQAMAAAKKGASAKLTFFGNRVDLIGRRLENGGSVEVLIDGKPAARAPAYLMTYIEPGAKNSGPNWPRGDKAPHAVELGRDIVPQTWTITMTSDTGDYELTGSKTGADGAGNVMEYFTSDSGQIEIDPQFWRGNGRIRRGPKKGQMRYGAKEGDTFTFEVTRAVRETVSFDKADHEDPDGDGLFVAPLVQNLTTGQHTVEIVVRGDGPVAVDSLYVYQPPLDREP